MKLLNILLALSLLFALILGCSKSDKLGSAKNPIKLYFVPSVEGQNMIISGNKIADHLRKETGYYFKTTVPTNYTGVVEALGTGEADIAWLATFAYVLAHEKYGAEVALTTLRNGKKHYRGQFIASADSTKGINSIDDIEGKTIAYTDASSTSGYIYPSALLSQKGITPGQTFFAGGHPQAVLAVYQDRADVGCTFGAAEESDARATVAETYPDVFEKVKIIGYTDWIPNDTVTFRKEFPEEMKEKIVKALIQYMKTSEGKEVLGGLYGIDGLDKAFDGDYEVVRKTLKALGKDASELIEK